MVTGRETGPVRVSGGEGLVVVARSRWRQRQSGGFLETALCHDDVVAGEEPRGHVSAAEYLQALADRWVAEAKRRTGDDRAQQAAAGSREVMHAAAALEAVGLLRAHEGERFLGELESLGGSGFRRLTAQSWWWRLRYEPSHPVRLRIANVLNWLRDVADRGRDAPVLTGIVPGPFPADDGHWCVASLERWSSGGVLHLVGTGDCDALPRALEVADDLGTDYALEGGGGGGDGRSWQSSCRFTPAVPAGATALTVELATGSARVDLTREAPAEP